MKPNFLEWLTKGSQYAQRARAIQSKPQIQQVTDDSDKQALIDRLRAEVAFLREQIRNSERTDRRFHTPQERAERQNEREVDLQNQLLDIQESYSALGHRHAKLISEIAKAQDVGGLPGPNGKDPLSNSALERLKRSNSFAEAVEQVVLEYEKTIQSLETSLSNTRSSLATTESSLLEKESKCAYSETTNQQLQARLQKMMDRENSTENYLNELETKLDGHTSGEEKNAAIVVELRKEIGRVRENEASCEDYISTLEERLAEADQDAEQMQREIERLEHVVDRQRSLGKLDSLLYELDHAQQGIKKAEGEQVLVNGPSVDTSARSVQQPPAEESPIEANDARYFDAAEGTGEHPPSRSRDQDVVQNNVDHLHTSSKSTKAMGADDRSSAAYPTQSPAQSDFVAEKLDTVTQELLDLRVEHETTLNEFELLSVKYEDALRTLGQLQDAVDEARHPTNREVFATPASTRPSSFLGDARVTELKEETHLSSSRSLSSELYSAGESPNTTEPSDVENAIKRTGSLNERTTLHKEHLLMREVEHLRQLQSEKDESLALLTKEYDRLQEQHQEILDEVEELKTEVSKAKMNMPTNSSPIIRRKSSQGVMMVDRAHRSFASLRNIAAENFEDKPDVMQNFELNLNTAMHELYARSERVQELEADITSVKREMETKMTIISGLTRERSSMKNSSPMDMSVVSTMRDQLLQSENKIRVLQETQSIREKTLLAEIDELNASLEEMKAPLRASSKGPASEETKRAASQEKKVVELQEELGNWESRHQSTVESMQASESRLIETIREMDAAVSQAESQRNIDAEEQGGQRVTLEEVLEKERATHMEIVVSLQNKIEDYTNSLNSYMGRVAELEHVQTNARRELEESAQTKEAQAMELRSHSDAVSRLEQQVYEHQSTIQAHEEGLRSLQATHASHVEELRNSSQADTENRLAEQAARNEDMIHSLQAEITEAKDEMGRLLQSLATVLGEEMEANKLQSRVQALVRHNEELNSGYAKVREDTERFIAENARLKAAVTELTGLNNQSVKEIERLNEQCQKSSRIVEDLEEQLTANFDQHQAAHNRLSVLESERNHRVEEVVASKNQALAELEATREEVAKLEVSPVFLLLQKSLSLADVFRPSSFRHKRLRSWTMVANGQALSLLISARALRPLPCLRHLPPSPCLRYLMAHPQVRPTEPQIMLGRAVQI